MLLIRLPTVFSVGVAMPVGWRSGVVRIVRVITATWARTERFVCWLGSAEIAHVGPRQASHDASAVGSNRPKGNAVLVLVSGATKYPRSETVGHLIVPKAWALPASLNLQPGNWAMDNGAFSGFDEGSYVRMLERFAGIPGCLFATAPDVVGDAASTLARWPFWSQLLRGLNLPPAFVAQDGLTADRVPWTEMGALFIGGTTEYKESREAAVLCGYAKSIGKWVHWGRVNGRRRYHLAKTCGCDSIDGTGFSKHPDTNIPLADEWDAEPPRPNLFEAVRP